MYISQMKCVRYSPTCVAEMLRRVRVHRYMWDNVQRTILHTVQTTLPSRQSEGLMLYNLLKPQNARESKIKIWYESSALQHTQVLVRPAATGDLCFFYNF